MENTNTNVVQNEDAIIGENVESDSNLRARRAQSTGADGITVLESLVGSLLGLSGIKDAKVYFKFANIIETSSYSNLTYGVLAGKIISNNRLTSTFEINYGYENKNTQAIDVSFMKLNKDNDIHINYYFMDTFLQRAITKINETRQPVNKIAEHILPAILKERNNRLKDIADE